jgi:MYXO-CTERM domain-containing protein
MTPRTPSLLALIAALPAPLAAADVTYSYDSGTTTTAVGPPGSFPVDPQTAWGNYFTAEPGGEVITTISVAFGPTFAAGREVTVWLFEDPDDDFDPRNAVPLTSTTLVPEVLGGSTFNHFPIAPTQISGGFFALALAFTERGVDRPAALDSTARDDRSWLFYNPATQGINVDNLGANALARRVDDGILPFPGAWMIRATGTPVPTPAATALLGVAGAALLRRRR